MPKIINVETAFFEVNYGLNVFTMNPKLRNSIINETKVN
jgi:hypothetical protein